MRNTKSTKSLGLLFLFLLLPALAFSQRITLQGVVNDAAGTPLPGVIVAETGTNNASFTDGDGRFTLTGVSPEGRVSFTLASYLTQEVDVAGRTSIEITLLEDATMIESVVVSVGYGSMRRADLTGAVTSVGSEAISRSVATSLDQVLAGRAAGVQVQQNSGMPGASATIRIRGINSLNASTQPIYVIDGVVIQGSNSANSNPLSSINTADIESMDILKDASATAIYGAQASNGVIIVNTKRGKTGQATISLNSYVGWEELPKHLDVLNLREYATLRNIRAEMLGGYNNEFVRADLLGEGTDWQNELFNRAPMHSHNLSVSGGTEAVTYNLSAGYLNQKGIAEGSGFRRLTLSGNFDAKLNKWVRSGVNFAFAETKQVTTVGNNVDNSTLILTALRSTPNVPVRNVDGTFGMPDGSYLPINPIALAMLYDNHNSSYGARANTFVEVTPTFLEGLSYRTEFAFDANIYNGYRFVPTYFLSDFRFNDVNSTQQDKNFNLYYSWRNIVTYDRTFGRHKINAMLGHEMSKSAWENLMGSREGLPTNGVTDITRGDATKARAEGSTGASALLSYFGRAFYSLDDKYLLTATIRRDGSSKFAPQNRWGWFPSFALAWRMSEESWLKGSSVVSNLKLRAGWGLVGNQNIPDNNAWKPVYNTTTTPWGTGLLAGNTPNESLTWESTSSANIGFDLGLLNDRIDLVVDFYLKRTNDLLMVASLPAFVGTGGGAGSSSAPWVNLGSLQNKGFEITLNTRNIETRDFSWSTNFIFSLNRNEVIAMNTATGEDIRSTPDWVWGGSGQTPVVRSTIGQPIGQFYGYQLIGRFNKPTDLWMVNNEGKVVRTPVFTNSNGILPIDLNTGVWVGDYIYRDVNGDGIINEQDRGFIGNPEPDFTIGLNNTFTYKGFDLGIQLVGVFGNDVVNYSRRYMGNPYFNNSNLFKYAMDFAVLGVIDPDKPDTDYRNIQVVGGSDLNPRLSTNGAASDHNFAFSDRFVEDGSYVRIQNVSIGYTFPQRWMKKIWVSNLKIYANLQNLYTFTKYTGFDPEIGAPEGLTGVDTGRYPSPRVYTFGVNLTF